MSKCIIPKEFNGLPVIRRFKQNSSNSEDVMLHPTGIRLLKCADHYVVLCLHENCIFPGCKPDIKCFKHSIKSKCCREDNCLVINIKRGIFCPLHKRKKSKCNKLGCSELRRNNVIYCTIHERENLEQTANLFIGQKKRKLDELHKMEITSLLSY